ncbi:MAG: nitrogenase stabilizing/protective protein NifW [Burkholderiaceae bacterium]|nr:nitrogenase stabilizing/protective protein NifW [Burkholderiaceae bacterium]
MESLIQRLKTLSSAEDFLAFFGVPFDERVVQVNRLHILKRFYQYLHQTPGTSTLDDVALFRCQRELLTRAYGDFVTSTPAREKVFKVFQDAQGQQSVALTSLRDSLADRRPRSTPPPATPSLAALSPAHPS